MTPRIQPTTGVWFPGDSVGAPLKPIGGLVAKFRARRCDLNPGSSRRFRAWQRSNRQEAAQQSVSKRFQQGAEKEDGLMGFFHRKPG